MTVYKTKVKLTQSDIDLYEEKYIKHKKLSKNKRHIHEETKTILLKYLQ